ncbi:MAG: hypothetical protein EOO65_00610 [Methanosarcinales archaeon]|nr:MAG: hypothetical protein EOO65_00610 [Methanosarcinales archaeon]
MQTITFNMGSAHASDGSSDEKMALFGTSSATNFAAAQGTSAAGQLRVTYTDSLGGQYVAHAVSGVLSSDPTVSRNSLEVALETLPDQKVTDVKVVSSLTGSATTDLIRTLTVTFLADATNSNNVGMQPLLQCDSGYSCTEQGCFPMVKMPFLYRYAAIAEGNIGSTFATGNLAFYSGTDNGNANVVRLAATSQPQMPAGIAVDTGYDNAHLYRYDMRIVVAVVGGASADVADKYYTRVIAGHDNINSASEAMFGIQGVLPTSVSGSPTRSINTMTYQGPIPNPFSEVPVAGAPGVLLQFPSRKWVADGQVQFSEILIKLPFCSVTADASSVDVNVENVECGSRGQCNRETGACNCFPGYTGVACQMQTVMV